MTRDVLLAYVTTLDLDFRKLFYQMDRYMVEFPDTLSEEFQLAASIVKVFEERAIGDQQ